MYRLNLYRVLWCGVLFLAGCTVGPDFKQPAAPPVSAYTKTALPKVTAGHAQQFAFHETLESDWWRLFHSKEINQLVAQGIAQNPNLLATSARLKAAEETLNALKGNLLFPSLGLTGSASRQRFANSTIGTTGSSVFNLLNVSVNASYIFDIFGGVRRQIEAGEASVQYEYFMLQGAYLSLTANIVTTAMTIAALRSELKALDDAIDAHVTLLSLMEKQLALGGISYQDVLSEKEALNTVRAEKPPLEKNLATATHALAVLLGEMPSDFEAPALRFEALQLPKRLPLGLPSSLVNERPDIKAQVALLHEASANIGVATANLLPSVTLTAGNGWASTALSTLFSTPTSGTWNLGAAFTQPLYQGGALLATRRAKIDAYLESCMLYRQTVLEAFANVADSLRAIEMDAKLYQDRLQVEEASRTGLTIVRGQYRLGGVSYLSVLKARIQHDEDEVARIQSNLLRYNDTVALFQSLGGQVTWHS